MIIYLKKRYIQKWALFSFALILLNLTVWKYMALDIEYVDLSTLAGRCIVLDPGHGGIDDGTSWYGFNEKDINLAIALKLRDRLIQNGANVILTREDDRDYYTKGKGGKRHDLLERVKMINGSNADVFVSIHVNADKITKCSGIQVFYNPQREENKIFAETMHKAFSLLNVKKIRDIRQTTSILILNEADKPGVLVEVGFLSNPEEAKLLANSDYQQKLVEVMVKGLAYHLSQNVAR